MCRCICLFAVDSSRRYFVDVFDSEGRWWSRKSGEKGSKEDEENKKEEEEEEEEHFAI